MAVGRVLRVLLVALVLVNFCDYIPGARLTSPSKRVGITFATSASKGVVCQIAIGSALLLSGSPLNFRTGRKVSLGQKFHIIGAIFASGSRV